MSANTLDVALHLLEGGTFSHKNPRYCRVYEGEILRYANERGPNPCTVELYLMKSDLDLLTAGVTAANSATTYHAEVEVVWNGRSKWLKGLYFAGAERVEKKGSANDPYGLWKCKFHDIRWICGFIDGVHGTTTVNTRRPGVYRAATDAGGNLAAWDGNPASTAALTQWQAMVTSAWNAVPPLYLSYGSGYTLPYTPHDVPEHLDLTKLSAYDALNRLLHHLHCALSFNPHADTLTVVRLGGTDANLGTVDAALPRLDSDEFSEDDAVRLPYSVTTLFRSSFVLKNGQPAHSITKTAADCGYTATYGNGAGTTIWFDDAVAVLANDGSLLDNSSVLNARALERATNLYRDLSVPVRHRVYFGPAECPPGEEVQRVVWDADSSGVHSFVNTRPYFVPNDLPLPAKTGDHVSPVVLSNGTPSSEVYTAKVMPDTASLSPIGSANYPCVAVWGEGSGAPTFTNDTVVLGTYLGVDGSSGPRYVFIDYQGVTVNTVDGITDLTFDTSNGLTVSGSAPSKSIGFDHQYDLVKVQNDGADVESRHTINFKTGGPISWNITDSGGVLHVEPQFSSTGYVLTTDVSTTAATDKIPKAESGTSQLDSNWIKTADASTAGKVSTSAQTFAGKKTFSPTGTDAGLNVGSNAGAIASPAAGDIVRNSTTDQYQIVLDI